MCTVKLQGHTYTQTVVRGRIKLHHAQQTISGKKYSVWLDFDCEQYISFWHSSPSSIQNPQKKMKYYSKCCTTLESTPQCLGKVYQRPEHCRNDTQSREALQCCSRSPRDYSHHIYQFHLSKPTEGPGEGIRVLMQAPSMATWEKILLTISSLTETKGCGSS